MAYCHALILSVSQSGSASFQVDPETGNIVLVKELDYEALTTGTKFYVLAVTATDGGGLQVMCQVSGLLG